LQTAKHRFYLELFSRYYSRAGYECLAYYEDHRGEIDFDRAAMTELRNNCVRFLLDNDMPDVVARVLVEAGHE